jgi:hypothetical protein
MPCVIDRLGQAAALEADPDPKRFVSDQPGIGVDSGQQKSSDGPGVAAGQIRCVVRDSKTLFEVG